MSWDSFGLSLGFTAVRHDQRTETLSSQAVTTSEGCHDPSTTHFPTHTHTTTLWWWVSPLCSPWQCVSENVILCVCVYRVLLCVYCVSACMCVFVCAYMLFVCFCVAVWKLKIATLWWMAYEIGVAGEGPSALKPKLAFSNPYPLGTMKDHTHRVAQDLRLSEPSAHGQPYSTLRPAF